MSVELRKWREGKVRPIPGNSPPARPVSRSVCSLRRVCDDPFSATPLPQLPRTILGAQYAFLKAWRNLSVRCGPTTTKPWGETAPPPVRRPRAQVEERVGRTTLCSSSAMSSDRLFLDRVARQHCPSPLHRHAQTTTPPHSARPKPDISTLQRIGHFYFALTPKHREFPASEPAAENRRRRAARTAYCQPDPESRRARGGFRRYP
jgi:hypothetical protein